MNKPIKSLQSVHILRKPSPEALLKLEENLDKGIRVSFGMEIPHQADYQILVGGVFTREWVTASPNLQKVIIPWAGLPTNTRDILLDYPQVSVYNLHHNAAPTAEMAVALLFAAAKQIIPMDRALRASDWWPRYRPTPAILLMGKTVLVLGYGAIGQKIGEVLKAVGMRILAIRKNPEPDEMAEVFPPTHLHELLPQADVLMIALPLTSETEGMIGKKELSLLPKGGILVNVGRGPVVAQEALYVALRNRDLGAAGLDVWYNYPEDENHRSNTPPADFPFYEMDNVVMSPHRGGGTVETELLRMVNLADSLNAAARGKSVPNYVDLRAGY